MKFILYLYRLSGRSPFKGKNKEEILQKNKLCDIDFDIFNEMKCTNQGYFN